MYCSAMACVLVWRWMNSTRSANFASSFTIDAWAMPTEPSSLIDFTSSGNFRRLDRCTFRFRSEEHTSELQSQSNLVCRLLLEKKKQITLISTPVHDLTAQ